MTKSETDSGARDYRATLFLPATDFPMKAGLPEAEPKWLARWQAMDLYGKQRAAAKGRKLFILHDGPIYANGDIHSGTGLNHILKDFVVRSQQMLGKDAPYVPGWDCHGLPIEWKVEEKYRAEGKSKDDVPKDELRRDCREFATFWLDVQREQIKRLGCSGDWDRPYTTMNFKAEAAIAREAHKFVANGLLYRGFRPVMWSPVEKTALAEAEVEYHEKTSPTIYVKFPLIRGAHAKDASIVIWTTTPWTIPGNRAIAFSGKLGYGLYEVVAAEEGAFATLGEKIALADALAEQTAKHAKITLKRLNEFTPLGHTAAHPLRGKGYDFPVLLLEGDHVTDEAGTGFVHTAPGHGEEDFELGQRHRLEIPRTVDEDGSFYPEVPLFAGKRILTPEGKDGDANGAVIKELINAGALLAKGSLRHSYPHSWRSKAPVIYRATPQWFVAIDRKMPEFGGDTLRRRAMKAIADTAWYPPQGANRIGSMVESRPDWVLSRQRAWGVPLAIFVDKKTQKVLNDPAVNARISDAFETEGADAWFTSPPQRFLDHLDAADYEQVTDILDVWFDSGSTYVFTIEQPIDAHWPRAEQADLYLEGSDQHRGWFQSSLLESCGTRGRAPYKAVLTHGFVMDDQGRKMSKSLGNTLAPQVIADKNGADILRLWSASSDFTEDLRIGQDIIKANVDAYRKIRNALRFLLGNLAGFDASEVVPESEMPELERYMLWQLEDFGGQIEMAYKEFRFRDVYKLVMDLIVNDLSAFYFDIRKDVLYCDSRKSIRRRSARTVLDEIFTRLEVWLAPILCFTTEEAWLLRHPDSESVHLELFPEARSNSMADGELFGRWNRVREIRRVVTGALEIARRDKVIGASLEAAPLIILDNMQDADILNSIPHSELAAVLITSEVKISEVADVEPSDFTLPDDPRVAVRFHHARGDKCARCWMILEEVGKNPAHDDLCNRCAEAVDA